MVGREFSVEEMGLVSRILLPHTVQFCSSGVGSRYAGTQRQDLICRNLFAQDASALELLVGNVVCRKSYGFSLLRRIVHVD